MENKRIKIMYSKCSLHGPSSNDLQHRMMEMNNGETLVQLAKNVKQIKF